MVIKSRIVLLTANINPVLIPSPLDISESKTIYVLNQRHMSQHRLLRPGRNLEPGASAYRQICRDKLDSRHLHDADTCAKLECKTYHPASIQEPCLRLEWNRNLQ